MTMERRDFLKKSLLALFCLYGISDDMSCFAGKNTSKSSHTDAEHYPFTGVHSATFSEGRVVKPDVFSQSLFRDRFVLFVPEKNTSVLVVKDGSSECEALKQLYSAAVKDGALMLWEDGIVDEKGCLYVSEKVSKFAGLRSPTVTIVGHGSFLEIIDPERYHSRTIRK